MMSLRKKIINDTKFLAARDILGKILQIPVTIVSANVLGAEVFGLLKIINFIPSITKFGGLGLGTVVTREVSKMTFNDSRLSENLSRNIAFSATILWALLLSGIVFIVSFFYTQIEIVWGLRIVSMTLFVSQIYRLYKVNCKILKDFKAFSIADSFSSVFQAVFILTTIYWLGIYSGLFASLLAAIIGCIILNRKVGLVFKPQIKKDELFRQLKIGIPLSLTTLFFGVWGWSERIVITNLWGLQGLGIYMLAIIGMQSVSLFMSNSLQAMTVHIYEKLGHEVSSINTHGIVYIPTLTFVTLTSIIGGGFILLGPSIITLLLPEYCAIIPLFPWMAVALFFPSISNIYEISMNSTHINQQNRIVFFRIISIIIFIMLTYYLWIDNKSLTMGMISRAVAMASLSFMSIISTKNYFYSNYKTLLYEIIEYIVAFIWVVGLAYLIMMQSFNISINILLYFVISTPVILNWERKVGLLQDLYKMYK